MKYLILLFSLFVLQPAFGIQVAPDTLHTYEKMEKAAMEEEQAEKSENKNDKENSGSDFMSSWKFYFIVLIFPAMLLLIAVLFIFKRKK